MKKYSYDVNKYDFVNQIESLYGISDLSMVHSQWSDAVEYEVLDDVETDQKTVYHKKFYKASHQTNFYDVYKSFIEEFVKPIVNEKFLYQRIPTFRVHQPSNLAVAAFHKDSDYSHSEHEINFYLPLTKAWGNNTIWTESEVGKKDYNPIEANVGELWMWNGANLLHGNKINDTGVSRVSVDFRVLPMRYYEDTNMVSITNKTKMVIGDYWECI